MTGKIKQFDVIKTPFPFSDIPSQTKFRPALVVSSYENFGSEIEHSVVAMITTAKHSAFPLDVKITDINTAGLPVECIVRMKFFTLDNRIITEKVGTLCETDRKTVASSIQKLFHLQQ